MDMLISLGDEVVVVWADSTPACRARRSRWFACRWWLTASWLAMVGTALAVVCWSAINGARESHRAQCAEHLKILGRAMAEYQEKNGHFPPPAIGSRNRPLLSWRVALLPYLGYQSLYVRFHLDEPWHSPHNRALLAAMPPEFGCPSAPGRRQGRTTYMVVVGPITEFGSVNTPFQPSRGVDIREMTDGASNTVLVFETNTLVPWTKPDDLSWAPGEPVPKLESPHSGGTHILLADGSTRFIKLTMAPNILVGLLTMNGGEVLSAG
jgi:prepilin-type processing-associated H-X9-DG protein